jgi:hypothetical protein
MTTHRCPGQDLRFWKVKDIFEVRCPHCGGKIEFWKDDPFRSCPACNERVSNPRINLSCAKWCQYAEECLGTLPDVVVAAAPVIERLMALLTKHLAGQPVCMKWAREVCSLAETLMTAEGGKPHVIKPAALLAGALLAENGGISNGAFQENTPLDDGHFQKTLLEEAGIETSIADEICAIIEAILSGKTQETIEFAVVWDAIQLERLSLMDAFERVLGDPVIITQTIRTQSGRRMAERYNDRQETEDNDLSPNSLT